MRAQLTKARNRRSANPPKRRCIASSASLPALDLVRFAVGPDGAVVPDILGHLPGRGMWVKSDREALEKAVRRRLFSRAAKQPAEAPDNLADIVEAQLAKRVIELISVARKAGLAVAGFTKVKRWVQDGRPGMVFHASDGSPRQIVKLRGPEGDLERNACLTAAELGMAFGRENVVHVAVDDSGMGCKVSAEARRLAGVRIR